ncbi:MAG: lactonase family protein [Caulobacteraceae bacterium]
MTPSPSRRLTLACLAALTPARVFAAGAGEALYAYVGAYTPNGGGIHVFRMDSKTGRLQPLNVTSGIANPTWLIIDQRARRLFALAETADYGPNRTGSVTAYSIGRDGALTALNTVGSGAAGPAHLSLHPSGRFVFVSDYRKGAVAVLPVDAVGRLGEAVDVRFPEALPPEPSSTEGGNFTVSDHTGPHMHMAMMDPSNRWLVGADAGSDRLYVWRLDPANGRLSAAPAPFAAAPPGSAPRHFAFSRSGRRLFVLQEHDARIATWDFDPATGALRQISSISSLPEGFAGSNLGSELAFSPGDRFLYAANRLRDAITQFEVASDGRLTRRNETWTQGDYPRSFNFTPDGRWLIACCQHSDALTSFRVDPANGRLTFTGAFTPVGSPACVAFTRA